MVQQIRKTPIVVNDSRGFYTSRVYGTLINEAAGMLERASTRRRIERAATQAGYPVAAAGRCSTRSRMDADAKIRKATDGGRPAGRDRAARSSPAPRSSSG